MLFPLLRNTVCDYTEVNNCVSNWSSHFLAFKKANQFRSENHTKLAKSKLASHCFPWPRLSISDTAPHPHLPQSLPKLDLKPDNLTADPWLCDQPLIGWSLKGLEYILVLIWVQVVDPRPNSNRLPWFYWRECVPREEILLCVSCLVFLYNMNHTLVDFG